ARPARRRARAAGGRTRIAGHVPRASRRPRRPTGSDRGRPARAQRGLDDRAGSAPCRRREIDRPSHRAHRVASVLAVDSPTAAQWPAWVRGRLPVAALGAPGVFFARIAIGVAFVTIAFVGAWNAQHYPIALGYDAH